jgi:hypothetical protein
MKGEIFPRPIRGSIIKLCTQQPLPPIHPPPSRLPRPLFSAATAAAAELSPALFLLISRAPAFFLSSPSPFLSARTGSEHFICIMLINAISIARLSNQNEKRVCEGTGEREARSASAFVALKAPSATQKTSLIMTEEMNFLSISFAIF